MKTWKRLLSLFAICMFLCPDIQVQAATDETTYYEKLEDSYGVNSGKFKVNGILAYCANSHKDSPPRGTKIESIKLSTNKNLRKVLWYGSVGPGAILEDDDDGWIQTAQAVSLACENGTVNSRYKDWYESVIKKEEPPSGFKVYIATPEVSSLQPLAYFLYEPLGKGQLVKVSASDETKNNGNYSLEGAQYGVFTNKACTTKVATFETESNGKSNILELEPKTYYVKETVAPKGFELSTTIHTMVVQEDKTTVINVKDNPIKGKLQVIKSSARPDITGGNECYTLEGAQYGVFADKACAKKVATFETEANGKSNVLSLIAGTYYVKETKRPNGYALDDTVYTVKVTANSSVTVKLSVKDEPQLNPIDILLKKVDAQTHTSKSRGMVSLKGAHYTVKYYGVLLNDANKDPAKSGMEPTATWIFETDENGKILLDESFKISGDELYTSADGSPAMPLGTITIQETKAPEGYLLNPDVFVRQITVKGVQEAVDTYNSPTVSEQILKLDLIKLQEGTDIQIPGTVFEHTKPDGTVETLMTDEDGRLCFTGLQYGEHTVREVSVMEGYLINENVVRFTVHTDNAITLDSTHDDSRGKIDVKLTEEGNIMVTVYDRLAPYILHIYKINHVNQEIDGAEFTVYEEPECITEIAKGITTDGGILKLEGLEVGKKYYLKETKAADGYQLSVDEEGNPIVYEIWAESVPAKDEFVFYVDGEAYQKTEMTIVNDVGNPLPNTGSMAMIPTVLLGSMLVLIGSYNNTRKKKGRNK